MKYEIYACDRCKAVLSDPNVAKPHISLKVQVGGWVSCIGGRWEYERKLFGTYQFCDADCLRAFFDGLRNDVLAEAVARGNDKPGGAG